MHNWQWQSWQGLPYLTCSLLESWPHGFFTQHFWPRCPEELVTVLSPNSQVYRIKQVHGNKVLSTREIDLTKKTDNITSASEELFSADGLVAETPNQAVWVCSADCAPVLIANTETGKVAAVHAGWRGTAANIVPLAIDRLLQQGSKLDSLLIAIGPGIAGEVYQVDVKVAAEVGSTIISNSSDIEAKLILDTLFQIPNSPLLADTEVDRVKLDVRRVIALQLEKLGILPEQVAIAPYCTYQNPDNFFSYRRDGLKKVQWSGIISK